MILTTLPNFQQDTTTLDSDQREILQQLTLLETNNNPQLNGGRIKTYQDFLTEGNSGSEFYNKLRNHAGPHFQQLLTLARNIEENQPLVRSHLLHFIPI